jgi:hypothetical protein
VFGKDGATSAGVVVEIKAGRPIACRVDLQEPADSSAFGPASTWLEEMGRTQTAGIGLRRRGTLADLVVASLQNCFLGAPERS